MKKTLLCFAAASAIGLTAAPAMAQGWQNINQRQANLDQRIDVGVKNGSLTRAEAAQLRAEYRSIAQLEARYRRTGGLDARERQDLDRRFDLLSQRIRVERNDRQDANRNNGGWQNINQRQANLDQRIDVGVKNGSLTRAEAVSLRSQFRDLAQLEARYRQGGLNAWERQDLDRRFDVLSQRINVQRHDRQDANRWNDRNGRWMNINQRQARLEQRIDAGVRARQLTAVEAIRLRIEFKALESLEGRYRAGGLNASERADLDRRFDALADRIHDQRTDSQRQYGWRW